MDGKYTDNITGSCRRQTAERRVGRADNFEIVAREMIPAAIQSTFAVVISFFNTADGTSIEKNIMSFSR